LTPPAPATVNGRLEKALLELWKDWSHSVGRKELKRCLKCKSTWHLARDCPNVHAIGSEVKDEERSPGSPPPLQEIADFTCEEDLVSRIEDLCKETVAIFWAFKSH